VTDTADGTIVTSEGIALVAFERHLPHPVDAVWSALTESAQLAAWLGEGSVGPHAGGEVSILTGPPGPSGVQPAMEGRVLEWDPPRALEYEWRQPGLDTSVVRYELEAREGATILKLTHRRSVAPGAFGGRAGWHAYLDRLTAHLDGLPVPAWSDRRAAVQAAYGEAPIQSP
jgi:uncharacterized protein YndB with AHSA1/START domain